MIYFVRNVKFRFKKRRLILPESVYCFMIQHRYNVLKKTNNEQFTSNQAISNHENHLLPRN